MHTDPWMPGLRQQRITVDDGVEINAWVGGQGPALLLVHGHPQTSAIWHRVAPRLAQQFTVVLADLRGEGDSSRPAGDPEHVNYSKRTMARDLLRLMARLGHEHFSVLAHDRGARVAHLITGRMMDFIEFEDGFAIAKIHAPLFTHHQALAESHVRSRYGVTVVGVKRPNEDFEHALPETRILPGDLLIVSGPTKKIEVFAGGDRKRR